MCNPPFHTSEIEANAGSQRKQNNLSKNQKSKHAPAPTKAPAKHALHKAKNDDAKAELNFGGRSGELWCPGGEATFIKGMIKESVDFKDQCLWFTSLVSKKDNLSSIYQALKKVNVADVKTINMAQGNKISRFVAWTFQPQDQHKDWF
jgi:23S rRNA (adenine1618-N6)-methyltransferase